MDEPTVLRTTKIGGGFVKEDVLTYLDELNSKISGLEEELKQAKESGPADPQELLKYRNQVDNLQEKLNASNNALRAAKKENEDLQKKLEESEKVIAQLRTGGAAPAAHAAGAQMNAQTQAALEAAKKEIDKLRAELKAANDKAAAAPAAAAPANAQITAALEAAKKEIDSLRGQLKTANDKLAAAHTDKAAPAGNPAAEAELVKAKQDIAKLTSDLEAKTAQLEAKIKEASETEGKIAELNKAKESAVADAVAKKDDEIKNLNKEIEELKANASNPAAMMGTLFAEAQKTVDSLKKQAEEEANSVTKEAKDKADKVVSEAQANADKTVREANEKADKTLKEATDTAAKTIKEANETAEMTVAKANAAAEKTIKDANDQAKSTVDDANSKADKINAMSSTVRLMLVNEIESVNSKFADIKSAMAKLTSQATDRMDEAQNIIGEARNSIEPEDKATVERASAPQAAFEAAKAPSGATPTFEPVSAKDGKNSVADEAFARVSGGSYNNGGNNKPAHNNNNNSNNNSSAAPEQKAAPKKNNFSFDMSDLLKAAEEEAAKESE
ncbi:hypothetical protein SAMN02910353_01334 [Ruminococcus sp. YRD2003]|uniref:hypothetical protein n=1 Tax=Ruminococcus sp. YRD2003 TaxID=1452313 RepID=UPI0008D6F716|nr:hypothetical protein SAMN02910353_01334 [Ruminococcus flavefaciens]